MQAAAVALLLLAAQMALAALAVVAQAHLLDTELLAQSIQAAGAAVALMQYQILAVQAALAL